MTHTQATFDHPLLPAHPDGYFNIDGGVTVLFHEDTVNAGYYWVQEFKFQNGDGGYAGLQTNGFNIDGNRTNRTAVFSISNNVSDIDLVPAPGSEANCRAFESDGVDGDFVSCRIEYPWTERIWCLGDDSNNNTRRWGGWIINESTGEETFIGAIDVPID
jgi:hypothetical protein